MWNPLFTQVVTILSHACDEIHKRPWYVCAFSAELVHISVEKISEYHTLMDKPNLTLLYNGSMTCVPSVTFLKHILYILSSSLSSTFKCLNGDLLFFFLASLWLKKNYINLSCIIVFICYRICYGISTIGFQNTFYFAHPTIEGPLFDSMVPKTPNVFVFAWS